MKTNIVQLNKMLLSLILFFIAGLCLAQERVNTDNYQLSKIKTKKQGNPWALGMTLFAGYGTFGGDLRNKYRGYVPFGLSFDGYYRNIMLNVGMFGGYGKTKQDILYDTAVWKKGDWYEFFQGDISLGYVVSNHTSFKLTPFGGFSWLYFSPATEFLFFTNDEPSPWDDVDFDELTYANVGINIDLKGDYVKDEPSTFWSLRLRYAYCFPIDGMSQNGADGSAHSITIGVNYYFSDLKFK